MAALDYYDVAELAAVMVGKPEPDTDAEVEEIDLSFYLKYGLGLEEFAAIVEDLMPLLTVSKSELSQKTSIGFATDDHFLLKRAL